MKVGLQDGGKHTNFLLIKPLSSVTKQFSYEPYFVILLMAGVLFTKELMEINNMDKKRFIKDNFWEDEELLDADKNTKYLLLYLITNPSVNLSGIYKISERKMEFHTSMTLEEVRESLKRLEELKKVFYFDGWIFIKKFIHHNNLKNQNIVEGIKNALGEIPQEILAKTMKLGLDESLKLINHTLLDSVGTVSDTVGTPPNIVPPPPKYSNSNSNSKEIYTDILNFWNSKKIAIHKTISDKTKRTINTLLKEFSLEEIKKGISNYAEVYHSEITWFTYKWTLEEFLQRNNGFRVFLYKTVSDYTDKRKQTKDEKEGGWI